MPCSSYTPYEMEALRAASHEKQVKEITDRADRVTQLLCKLCSTLDQERADWAMPPDVRSWWQTHQETDKRRKAQERYTVAVRSLQGIQKTIQDIKGLGGEPSKSLKSALADAEQELTAASEDAGFSSYNGNF